ncbi:hypothetical protein KCU67_g13442, partial [Aureobasidium melanogenum]
PALDDNKSQSPARNIHDSNGVVESIEDHEETSMAESHDDPTGFVMENPFITPAGHIAPANLFHAPTGTFQNDYSLDTYNGAYAPVPFLNQNTAHSGSDAPPATDIGAYVPVPFLDQNTAPFESDINPVDIDEYLNDQNTNYTTSAGHGGDAGMNFGGDDEMDMDMATHAPMAEIEEPLIPGMEKYDDL